MTYSAPCEPNFAGSTEPAIIASAPLGALTASTRDILVKPLAKKSCVIICAGAGPTHDDEADGLAIKTIETLVGSLSFPWKGLTKWTRSGPEVDPAGSTSIHFWTQPALVQFGSSSSVTLVVTRETD